MLTLPQIELMQSDLPHTLYNRKKKNGDRKTVSEDDDAVRLNEMSLKRRMERENQTETESYTIQELFEGKADE